MLLASCESDFTGSNNFSSVQASYDMVLTAEEGLINAELNQITLMAREASEYLWDWSENQGEMVKQLHRVSESSFSFCADLSYNASNSQVTLNFGNGCSNQSFPISRAGSLVLTFDGENNYPFRGAFSVQFNQYQVSGREFRGSLDYTGFVNNANGYNTSRMSNLQVYIQGESPEESGPVYLDVVASRYGGEGVIGTDQVDGPTPLGYNATHNFIYNNQNTESIADDIVSLSGSASGINRAGAEFTSTIQETLQFRQSCTAGAFRAAVRGVKDITSGPLNFSVNFGSGECSQSVSVSAGGFVTSQQLVF
jgi:hypothetical protein